MEVRCAPRIGRADIEEASHEVDEWLYLPVPVAQKLVAELIFTPKGVVRPENTFKHLKEATRRDENPATHYTFEFLFEFIYYTSFLISDPDPKKIQKSVYDIIIRSRNSGSIKEGMTGKQLWNRLAVRDPSGLMNPIIKIVKEHIETHGCWVRTYNVYFPRIVRGTHAAENAIALYAIMNKELKAKPGRHPRFFVFADDFLEDALSGKLSRTEIRTIYDKSPQKVFTYLDPQKILAEQQLDELLERWKRDPLNDYTEPEWSSTKIFAKHMVELLISQAGMMPGSFDGTKVEYYDISRPNFQYARHHIDFIKAVVGLPQKRPTWAQNWWSWDLLLMGAIHLPLSRLESQLDYQYYLWGRSLKHDFMRGQCPDTWSPQDQNEYYGRLYDIIAEWLDPTRELKDKFSDPKFDWFKVKIGGNIYTLAEMLDPRVGLIEEEFVNGIIKALYKNIQEHSSFNFDAAFSEKNRETFINMFTN